MSLNFMPDSGFLAKRCICPDCGSSISMIAMIRSLRENKIKCPVCGTEVYAKRFWSYWLLDKMFGGVFLCIIVALSVALVVLYVCLFLVLAGNDFLFIAAIAIISMVFLVMNGKDITKRRALQFFSVRKFAGFRIEFTTLFEVVTFGLVWILVNGIFMIAYAWVTGSMPMKNETYYDIIFSGQILSSIELLFWTALFVIVPASLLYFLYIILFQKNVIKEVCYRELLAFYLACWIVILPVKISSIVSFYINKSFAAEIDQKTQPLFVSIESFINDYGRPPDGLQELVPGYMDSRSVMIFEKYPYDYRMISVDEQNFSALYVPVHCGGFIGHECRIVRLSGQNYSYSNMVESLPHPNIFKFFGRRLNASLVRVHGIHAFSNKKQNVSFYVWPPSD